MAARGEETRARLLDAAEALYGERGVDGVSLREIRIASGARNAAAVQFHFGDRDGLLQALAERHLPRIAAIQRELYDTMIAEGRRGDRRSLVEVLVRPAAEYVCAGRSERSWIRIMSDLASMPDIRHNELVDVAPERAVELGTELFEQMAAQMPRPIATERLFTVMLSTTHICADRARLKEHPDARPMIPDAMFVDNLVDMALGALFGHANAPDPPARVGVER